MSNVVKNLLALVTALAVSVSLATVAHAAPTHPKKHDARVSIRVQHGDETRTVRLGTSQAHALNARAAGYESCVNTGKGLVAFYGSGNPYVAVRTAVAARGCGLWLADSICWTSRQWWGGAARWVVQGVTGGRYSTC